MVTNDGYSDPHEYKGFAQSLHDSPMRNAFRGGSPGKTGAPKGVPEKEIKQWQLA
jgi:hypothetical protein